jgi:hypothetical protein
MKLGLSLNKSLLKEIKENKRKRLIEIDLPGKKKGKIIKPITRKTDKGEQMITKNIKRKLYRDLNWNNLYFCHKLSSLNIKFKEFNTFFDYNVINISNKICDKEELHHKIKNIVPKINSFQRIKDKLIILPQKEGYFKPKLLKNERINRGKL